MSTSRTRGGSNGAPRAESGREGFGDLARLLDQAPLVLFRIDREGRFTAAEGGGIGVVGVDVRAVVGRSAFEIFGDHPEIPEHIRRALRGESFSTITRVNDRAFETRYTPIEGDDGEPVATIGVAQEVTVREDAVRRLQASEQRYRAFAEHAHDAIVEIDRDTRILYASPRFSEVTGYPARAIEGKRGLELIHPEDVGAVEELGGRALDTETAVELTFRFQHRDGTYHWMELGGRPYRTSSDDLRAVLVVRDVSERIRVDQEKQGQLELESRVGELSRELLLLEFGNLEEGIVNALRAAAAMGTADRCYVISVAPSPDGEPLHFEWSDAGVERRAHVEVRKAARSGRWTADQLAAGKVVRSAVVADLPDEAASERDELQRIGVRSCLLIPVRSDGQLSAVLGFHCVHREKHWSDHEVYVLRLVAELLSSVLRRKNAEAAFQASNERFRALAENADDAICEIAADGRIRYANPRYQALLGYSLDELRAMPAFDPIQGGDRERLQQMHRVASSEPGSSGVVLYQAGTRDGATLWLEATGRGFRDASGEFRMVAVIRDVTSREQQQRALERRLELEELTASWSRRFLAIDSAEVELTIREGVGVVGELAGADRCWLLQLDAGGRDVRRAFGWRRPGVRMRPVSFEQIAHTRFPWAWRQTRDDQVLQVPSVAALPPEASSERDALAARGTRSLLALPVPGKHGLMGVLGIESVNEERTWDEEMTRRLRIIAELFVGALGRQGAEEALADSQAQLVQAQKMEAVGTLAGGIAHDFNNQLAVILGNARHVLRRLENDEEVHGSLVDLERAAEHCAQLTRSLLAFARQTPAQRRPIDAARVLGDVRELIAPLMPRSIDFRVEVESDLAWVFADPTQLQQVLVNLAVNARDAMPQGGHLSIGARNRMLDAGEADALGVGPGPFVEISVRDDGIGMDEPTRARIFDPFFTTKDPGKGTGLGLATAYGIVRDSGGAISVESEVGRGSQFLVVLPIAVEAEDASDDGQGTDGNAGSETVLLIEDESPVRRLVERMLVDRGYRVLVAADGADALRISEEHRGDIALAISDVVMPDLSGPSVVRRLQDARPELAVLFMSGYSEPLDRQGGAPLLQKPFTEPELLTAVRGLLDARS